MCEYVLISEMCTLIQGSVLCRVGKRYPVLVDSFLLPQRAYVNSSISLTKSQHFKEIYCSSGCDTKAIKVCEIGRHKKVLTPCLGADIKALHLDFSTPLIVPYVLFGAARPGL